MSLVDRVITIVSESLGADKESVSQDSDFYKDLNVDKLELTDLILKIQQSFNFTLEPEDFDKIKTVTDLVSLIETKSDEFET